MVLIDGSYEEGGGSMVRLALALSTFLQTSCEIRNIRTNRPQQGLKHQHLFCIKALEQLCNAKVQGAAIGSTALNFVPGRIEGKRISVDIQTAGSISLFTQAVLLPSFFADKTVSYVIKGGTDVKWAAPIDYFREVLLPHVQRFGSVTCKVIRRGYYPKGEGEVELKIKPRIHLADYLSFRDFRLALSEKVPAIHLDRPGTLMQIKGISHCSKDLAAQSVAERQAKAAEVSLSKVGCPVRIQVEHHDTASSGCGITLWALYSENEKSDADNPIRLGADSLGEKGKSAEHVGLEAAESLLKNMRANVALDNHLADQLLPFMALLPGSIIRPPEITPHALSNIHVLDNFLGKTFSTANATLKTIFSSESGQQPL